MKPPRSSKLNQTTREELSAEHQQPQEQRQEATEFNTAEEVIRYDQVRTEVPAAVCVRLRESIAREPRPARPWWQRWLGQPG